MGRTCSTCGRIEKFIQSFIRWEDNIKMDLKEVGCDTRNWMDIAQDLDKWQAYIRVVMNLRVP